MLRRFLSFIPLLLLAPLTGVSASEAPSIAVADGVATEIVYLLGQQDRIVGVDETSQFPPEAREKPQLGYFRRLAAEGIIALSPDILLTSPFAGPPLVLEQVKGAGIDVRTAPEVSEIADLPAKVSYIAEALGVPEKGAALAGELMAEIEALAEDPLPGAPKVLFVITIRDGAPLVTGSGTPPHQVITAAGAVNAADFEGYKPMSREAIIAAAPDLVLMTEEHAAALGGAEKVLSRPEFALTPAGQAGLSLQVPALTVMGLGPRTPASVRRLKEALRR